MEYFISSDIHGFYTEWKKQLKKSGFDINNPNHKIVLLGDTFDRGKEAKKLLNYLWRLPAERLIYIRGNHEDLFEDCLQDLHSMSGIHRHHLLNGTLDTISQLTGYDEYSLRYGRYHFNDILKKLKRYFELVNRCVNYYEINNNIFVHGWIPVITNDLPVYYIKDRTYEFNPDWRNASEFDWEQARWLNGIDMNHLKLQDDCATIYCGHWHASYGHSKYHNKCSEFGADAIFEPYYEQGIVALDGCTAHSGKVNVVVLEI